MTAVVTAGTGVAVRCHRLVQIYPSVSGQVAALSGVDLELAPGEQVALLGPSGSGKSTLLGLLAGIVTPSAGQLLVGDVDLGAAGPRQLRTLRARTVGTLLQGSSRNLLGFADAVANIGYARRAVGRRTARTLTPATDLLDAVGIAGPKQERPVAALSGGERQRVALAVALANGPGLLLADEPTSDLDATLRDTVMDVVTRTAAALGCTTVVVTHDPAVAARLARQVVIRDGRIDADSGRTAGPVEVDDDGRIPLPPALRTDWPAGTRVQVRPEGVGLRITREDA